MSTWFVLLCQLSVLALALLGGVFLAFSDFIMRSLDRAGTPGGVAVMQSINREVFRYVFMSLFLGMLPVSLLIAGYATFGLSGPASTLIVAAAVIYLLGAFGVTVVFNVPLNDSLAVMDVHAKSTQDFWESTYLPRWTFWNGVRTAACAAASGLMLFGLAWWIRADSVHASAVFP
jgi:uncharacterized membrane protein